MNNIVEIYQQIKSVRGINKLTGMDRDAISRELAKHGIINFLKITDEQIKHIVDLYNNQKSVKEIAQLLNMAQKKVIYVLISKSLMRKRTSPFVKNEFFFETIDNEENAYWLGYLYADGYVHKNTTNVELCSKDREHLEKFKSSICKSAKIKEKIVILNGKSYTNYRITISSIKLVNDLIKHGCFQAKSLTLKFPTTVPDNLMHHFIRGYFDGDGSTGIYKLKSGALSYNFKLIGTKEFLTHTDSIICDTLNLNPVKLYRRDNGKIYQYSRGGANNFKKMRNYLYNNATIYLNRKREIMFSF